METRLTSCLVIALSCLLLACNPARVQDESLSLAGPIAEEADFCELSLDQLSELNVLITTPHTSSAVDEPMQGYLFWVAPALTFEWST